MRNANRTQMFELCFLVEIHKTDTKSLTVRVRHSYNVVKREGLEEDEEDAEAEVEEDEVVVSELVVICFLDAGEVKCSDSLFNE